MSVYSQKRVTRFCVRRGWRNCTITLLICGLTSTSVALGWEHILLGFDRLVLSGPDIPSACFDLLIPVHWQSPDCAPRSGRLSGSWASPSFCFGLHQHASYV
jgi:hypothetical protein